MKESYTRSHRLTKQAIHYRPNRCDRPHRLRDAMSRPLPVLLNDDTFLSSVLQSPPPCTRVSRQKYQHFLLNFSIPPWNFTFPIRLRRPILSFHFISKRVICFCFIYSITRQMTVHSPNEELLLIKQTFFCQNVLYLNMNSRLPRPAAFELPLNLTHPSKVQFTSEGGKRVFFYMFNFL